MILTHEKVYENIDSADIYKLCEGVKEYTHFFTNNKNEYNILKYISTQRNPLVDVMQF